MQQGWQCPVCGAVYAPFVRKCDGSGHYKAGSSDTTKFISYSIIPGAWWQHYLNPHHLHTTSISSSRCDDTKLYYPDEAE